MRRVESAYLDGELIRAGNIDAAIEAFERIDAQYGYSVAWIDCNSIKSRAGPLDSQRRQLCDARLGCREISRRIR